MPEDRQPNDLHNIGDPEELASLYVIGAMSDEQRVAFETHLEAGCRRCVEEVMSLDDVISTMSNAKNPMAPDPKIRARLMAQIDSLESQKASLKNKPDSPQVWKEWPADKVISDLFVQRKSDRNWESTGIDGVEVQRLFNDTKNNRMTALVRMAPGTSYPAHVHDGPEECFVLQGDLRVDDQVLHAGDYERRAQTSKHGVQSTQDGCMLLIVSSLSDELI